MIQFVGNGLAANTDRFYWLDVKMACCDGPLVGPMVVKTTKGLDSNNRVNLSLDPIPGATGYILLQTEEATVPGPGDKALVATSTSPNFTIDNDNLSEIPKIPVDKKPSDRPKPGTKLSAPPTLEEQLKNTQDELKYVQDQLKVDPNNSGMKSAEVALEQQIKDLQLEIDKEPKSKSKSHDMAQSPAPEHTGVFHKKNG